MAKITVKDTEITSFEKLQLNFIAVANLQPLVGEISWTKHIIILNRCKDNIVKL